MKHLKTKLPALVLALAVCFAVPAQALTVPQLRELLEEYYIDKLDANVLNRDTIDDTLKALGDPYTVYFTPDEYAKFQSSMLDGVVVGIGISAIASEQGFLIMDVYEASPAKELGLLPGDIITAVDQTSVAGMSSDEIVSILTGKEGTSVRISVLHENGTSETHNTIRRKVEIPQTTSKMLDGGVGLITCNAFGAETAGHFAEATKKHPEANVWMIDLRGNPGGDVDAAANALGSFFGKNRMFYLRDKSGSLFYTDSNQEKNTLSPMIVLTGEWTASASELFSGVSRDLNGGILIGNRTYGKGVAQYVFDKNTKPDYFANGDGLKITAAQYLTTAGNMANKIGIIPHLMLDEKQADEVAMLLTADEPKDSYNGYLRMDLGGWRWYINIEKALADEADFTLLLEALPPDSDIYQGKAMQWLPVTVGDLVKTYSLQSYTPRTFPDGDLESNTLRTYALVDGYEDGMFHPERSMSRAELCSLLTHALKLPVPKSAAGFSDVDASAWYAQYVNAACASGLMTGTGNGHFDPNATVNHEQLITVMGRVGVQLNAFLGMEKAPADHTGLTAYSDWAKPWVWLLGESQVDDLNYRINLLYDEPMKLVPSEAADRGEVAVLLYQLLTYINILPK
ncbi:MAG: S41 family peptidase [Evtepia sp.]